LGPRNCSRSPTQQIRARCCGARRRYGTIDTKKALQNSGYLLVVVVVDIVDVVDETVACVEGTRKEDNIT
jgi:hypothetical protein